MLSRMTTRRARFIVVVLVMLVPATAWAEGAAQPGFPCLGHWRGLGHTSGYTTSWTIDMIVRAPNSEGDCGSIEYTSPTCGGRMLDCRVEGGVVHVRERYTHDDGDCAPPGRLEFSCDGDQMQWAWIGWEVARSTLTRVGPAPPSSTAVPAPVVPSQTTSRPVPAERASQGSMRDSIGCVIAPRSESHTTGIVVGVLALTLLTVRRRRRSRTDNRH